MLTLTYAFESGVRKRGHVYGFLNLPFSSFNDFACDAVGRSLTCLTALPTEIRFNRSDPNECTFPFPAPFPDCRTAECRYCASSSSIMRAKIASGFAPTTNRPLMKNVGVPVTPARRPSSISFSTSA